MHFSIHFWWCQCQKMFRVKVDSPSSSSELNGTSSSDLNLTMYGMIIRDRYYRLPRRIAFKWIFMISSTLACCINEQFSSTAVAAVATTAVDVLQQEESWYCSIKMLMMCKYIPCWQNVNQPQLEKWLFFRFYTSINSFYIFSKSLQVLAIKQIDNQ